MTIKNFKTLIEPLFFRFRDVQSLWAQADFASASGNHRKATSIYRHLSKKKAGTPEAYLYAGLSEYRLNEKESAANTLEVGFNIYPEIGYLLEHFLRICSELGQIERAIPFIDQPSNCGDSATLWRLADQLLQSKHRDKAETIYLYLSKRPPISSEGLLHSALAEERLHNPAKAADLLEVGLSDYPGSGYLLEHYLRICFGLGQIDRVTRFIAPDTKNKTQACETLFKRLTEPRQQVELIDYCLRSGLESFAEEKLKLVLDNAQDAVILWRVAESLLLNGRGDEANKLYRKLSERQLECPEDYCFAGLASLRIEKPERCLEIFEQGQREYPEATQLSILYTQICAGRFEFERYACFTNRSRSDAEKLDFYRLAINNDAPETFIINFKEIELKGDREIQNCMEDEFISFLHKKPQPISKARLMVFFSKYLDINPDFSTRIFETLQNQIKPKDDGSKKNEQLLNIIHELTPPMVPHYSDCPDEILHNFTFSSKLLSEKAMEMDEPIADMTNNWTPWQNIFCLASPKLYGEAISAFEHLAFKAWPKLNFTAPHVYDSSVGTNKRIRIGFTVHDSMPMMSGLLSQLDRNIFETIFLRPGKAGLSHAAKNWVSRAERTVEYSDIDTYSAIETIANEELDIIVSGPSIAAIFYPMMARLAPLQMVLLEPNWTNGLTNADYYISWQQAEPAIPADYYRTAVSFFQHPPYWIERPLLDMSWPISQEARVETRQRLLKLGSESRVYLCANTPPKIHPEMDEIFHDLLERDKAATLVLLRGEYPPAKTLKTRLRARLGGNYERVIFLPTLSKDDAHLLLQSVDCCLDSYPLCGMSSSFDGAMLGVPIVTLPAEIPFGRWTASIYEYIGVSGLTAKNRKDYIEIAMKLASDSEWRHQLAMEIKEKSSRFVESQATSDEFQEFIIHAWKRTLAGLPPANWISNGWQ